MLGRSASCWARSCALMLSFSARVSRRPAPPCCSATDRPLSCRTTVMGLFITPGGVHAGLMTCGASATPSGRAALLLVLPRIVNVAARAAATRLDVNFIYSSPLKLSYLLPFWDSAVAALMGRCVSTSPRRASSSCRDLGSIGAKDPEPRSDFRRYKVDAREHH